METLSTWFYVRNYNWVVEKTASEICSKRIGLTIGSLETSSLSVQESQYSEIRNNECGNGESWKFERSEIISYITWLKKVSKLT